MSDDEFLGLYEHAGRAAARVVYAALVGLDHFDEELHDAARRIELAAFLALGARELREEVFVDSAEHVLGSALGVADADVRNQVDELAQALLVEGGPRELFRQHTLERWVVALDAGHRIVDDLPDGRLLGLRLEMGPARFGRDPEDPFRTVLVGVFGIGALLLF